MIDFNYYAGGQIIKIGDLVTPRTSPVADLPEGFMGKVKEVMNVAGSTLIGFEEKAIWVNSDYFELIERQQPNINWREVLQNDKHNWNNIF